MNFLDNPGYRGLGHAQVRWGYHLVNVLLHAANVAILYFVARRLLAAAIGDGAQSDRHERSLGEDTAGPSWSRRMAPERVPQPGPRP